MPYKEIETVTCIGKQLVCMLVTAGWTDLRRSVLPALHFSHNGLYGVGDLHTLIALKTELSCPC